MVILFEGSKKKYYFPNLFERDSFVFPQLIVVQLFVKYVFKMVIMTSILIN